MFWASAGAQTLPQFNIVKPSTTGVPGEEVRVMKFDPAGNLWIAGRFYFWGEAGLGICRRNTKTAIFREGLYEGTP